MKHIIFLLLVLPVYAYAQTYVDELCLLNMNGKGECKGVNGKVKYPCDWEVTGGAGNSITAKCAIYIFRNNSRIGLFFMMQKLKVAEKSIDSLIKEEMKAYGEGEFTFISGRKISINKFEWGEIIYKSSQTSNSQDSLYSQYGYTMHYFIEYKGVYISLNFLAMSRTSENDAAKLFEDCKELFRSLAKTLFITSGNYPKLQYLWYEAKRNPIGFFVILVFVCVSLRFLLFRQKDFYGYKETKKQHIIGLTWYLAFIVVIILITRWLLNS